uniref:EndoU domain-containing protein n=1 Tax=Pseudictyota dubia TaxID=2749911 RepID=A0A6U2B9D2_9STRA|mmetsp:Transcript_17686/g.32846  ORF Transcript_17686/g.32846 Transcript_17686/m.32846 type:complete len:485 (+) Transcript_17686:59-1513(+)|eukprot:CAMPEP_0197437440 /NCGR_PEP_ID=MMETSP1175-20131217/4684_1 /TAXON_ID=1003142 /ORGANISM="Triceratium dubium, Strain CCMP147" /LENGTH=484 /DNA_ID=CAMNT_0042966963 /DNA_START=33 /DNA_END=1487 /DNA_ORIENTATION=-
MADAVFDKFYRDIFADLTVDREESAFIKKKFEEANPPPDKLVPLRAGAFRIGCEFLSDNHDDNVSLLRAINAIVHVLETTCMVPKESGPWTSASDDSFEEAKTEALLRKIFEDRSIDGEENAELLAFFKSENPPPKSKLTWTRAAAFRIGCEFLGDDRNTNVALFRCINVVVHDFESVCLQPKPYVLEKEPPKQILVSPTVSVRASISKAAQHLWDLDVNRLNPNRDYKINVQGGKKPYQRYDSAPDPLFTSVDRAALRRPTYKAFIALLDNYEAEVGTAEVVTNAERREVNTFLRAIMQTAPMQFCHKYCRANNPNKVPSDRDGFIKLLHSIWFELYRRSRGGRLDSSGFEHVFVGEIKDGKVSGFHNWIYFYLEEKKGAVDYRGYIKPRSRNDAYTNSDDHILTLQFLWKGVEKSVGTSFVGVSPEFEMALYTMCFLVGEEENFIELDTGTGDVFELCIKCHTMARGKIGTSYAEALSHWEK